MMKFNYMLKSVNFTPTIRHLTNLRPQLTARTFSPPQPPYRQLSGWPLNTFHAARKTPKQGLTPQPLSTKQNNQPLPPWWSLFRFKVQSWLTWGPTNPMLVRLAQWTTTSALLIHALDILYTYNCNLQREKELARAFCKGSVPDISLTYFVERPGISAKIASLLQPAIGYNAYDMIVGYHGTGKTTLVRHLGHQHEGVIYLDVMDNKTSDMAFAKSFARATFWTPPRRSWFATMMDKFGIRVEDPLGDDNLFDLVFDEFDRQAALFKKKKQGRCAVLLIDNVNRLAARNPVLLEQLQSMAKDAADDRRFTTIFVTSEGQAPLQLMGRSASSRLGSMLAIGDINRDEVFTLLTKKRGLPAELTEEIFGLVGGRIKLIENVMTQLEKGKQWADVRHNILQHARNGYQLAKLQEHSVFRTAGLDIAAVILKHGSINTDDFFEIAGSYDHYCKLLSCNVFATIPLSNTITFQSKPMELVARELLVNKNRNSKPAVN